MQITWTLDDHSAEARTQGSKDCGSCGSFQMFEEEPKENSYADYTGRVGVAPYHVLDKLEGRD